MVEYIPLCVCVVGGVGVGVYKTHIFIHLSIDGHLGPSVVLAIVGSAAVNIGMHVSFPIIVFSRHTPRSAIAGLYSNSIFSF